MELKPLEDRVICAAHVRWYAAQPSTRCRRCDREFPNADGGKTEYCNHACEIGWIIPKPKRGKYRVPTHKRPKPGSRGVTSWRNL